MGPSSINLNDDDSLGVTVDWDDLTRVREWLRESKPTVYNSPTPMIDLTPAQAAPRIAALLVAHETHPGYKCVSGKMVGKALETICSFEYQW